MFKHFLGVTFRSLQKNKVFSFLNIFGLAIGLACAGLIFLWVEDELSWDSNEVNKNRIYQVRVNVAQDAGTWTHGSTPGPLGPSLASWPGVEATCRVQDETATFRIGERVIRASGVWAEPSAFTIFTIPFLQGNPGKPFTQLHSVVITESTARKFFGGDKDVVGRTVRMDDKQDYVVTGVVRDFRENATVHFEWMAPFEVYYRQNEYLSKWNNFSMATYVELKPGVDARAINRRLLDPKYDFTTQKVEQETSSVHIFLFGMKDWRLYDQFENGKPTGGGRIQYVRLFSTIAWIILFIACINFMNLATARSEKRAKEVGVRKVLGAGKASLVGQFLGEALLMSLLATAGAVLLMWVVLPAFNGLVGKDLILDLSDPVHLGALLALALFCGLIAGSYPSLYLSSFNPVFVLKGIRVKTGGAGLIRKGLVVLQFTVSIVLIIGTIVIYEQIQHVKDRNLGFNRNNLIQVPLQGDLLKNFGVIRQELLQTGKVENAALADHATLDGGNNTGGISWPGKSPDSKVTVSQRLVSPEYMSTMGMHIREGRDFGPADTINSQAVQTIVKSGGSLPVFPVLVTASMEKLMGKGSAVGKQMRQDGNFSIKMLVKGVVDDYVYGDMYGQADPVVFFCIPGITSFMYIRLRPGAAPDQALAKTAAIFQRFNPGYPFDYTFVDDEFNNFFLSEMLISRLSRVFAGLAILISCLGLFGLAAFMAERRIKEIGIRKVLGASSGRITSLLSKDFLRLVLVSCVIAFPLAGVIMHNWLQGYAYRIGLQWWVFALAGVMAIGIALITVGSQALRAAMSNPTNALRSE
jgi:putative ABC transport system permease protein